MLITRRKKGSQRKAAPIAATFHPNFTGQGGSSELTLETEDGYVILTFEHESEVYQLLSQAHIVHHNWKEPR